MYEGAGPVVLPTYGVIPGLMTMAPLFGSVEVDPAMLLHGSSCDMKPPVAYEIERMSASEHTREPVVSDETA